MPQKSHSSSPLRRLATSLSSLRQRHKERRRPTGFGFVFADRVDYLNPEHWDAVTSSRNVFLRREILRVIEQSGPENIQARYAIAFREAKPVVAIAAQVVSVAGQQLQPERPTTRTPNPAGLLKKVLKPATKAATARLRERILVAGNLLSWGFNGIAFAPDEEPSALWPTVAEAMYRIRRAERLNGQSDFIMVKDLTGLQPDVEALRRFSYRPLETEPNMVLAIQPGWTSYDDYLAALDAKYRRNAKDQIKKLTAAGCTVEVLSDLAPQATRLHELYLAVHSNAPIRLVTLPSTYLPALAQAAGEAFRCTVVRQGERVLGFVTSLRDNETAIAYYIGFDREAAAAGLPIYLRLLHATIADAIGWGCKNLSLGRTALEPKAGLGAKPEPMSVWLRHRVPTFNWLLRAALGAVPHAEVPERNPFKGSNTPATVSPG